MGLLRRMAGFLGFVKDEAHEVNDEDDERRDADVNHIPTNLPRKGFSVPVQVVAERAPIGPVLVPCSAGDGSVQGLRWYAKRLRIDEDGDVADEFLDEVFLDTPLNMEEHHRPLPRFEVKYSTRPAKVMNQALSVDGKIQLCVEYQDRLQWV
ncbi:unnamed protein product [Ilex paraguariensis]|uniref:Uncharacterized protein n=1 Tax=Ilex paraguariensis TaxID=185542 RepID=A0ABC8U2V3_9AQUA